MTEIGKMIREDGLKEGIEVGIREGKEVEKTEILIKLLVKKFKKIPTGYEEKIKKLPMATLDIIVTEIFDLESLEDLKKYL
ncbi:DUF4351 domain-containing protein [Clostridium sp. YIM B02505]|uniref:DUF4351 domain-containing protein n=1 Tax=Clostridium yunnanense TaxID=2800325 RepID=A0ABS1ES59_9CLOT|nr:DUF4351 domain-containing protein [Clostridium yunnanense]MBK1812185.1 DUF4351 domain-containing protein [Clostridium yunnanense]